MQRIKKEVIMFDENTFCGELAYGYGNKREAIKAIEELTGEKIEYPEDMQKLRVIKFKNVNGDEQYTWKPVCNCCGRKNDGVWSWANFN